MSVLMAAREAPSASVQFNEKGYDIVPGLMSREVLDLAFRYYLSFTSVPGYYSVAAHTQALDRYADALGEAMLPTVQGRIEQATGLTLLPTYSFARIYTTASRLRRHVDRGACEVSATMTVGFRNAEALWPIFVESEGADIAIPLDVGDALVYRGMQVPHWRDPLPAGIWCQLFFHFVEAEGAMKNLATDKRGRLGPWYGEQVQQTA